VKQTLLPLLQKSFLLLPVLLLTLAAPQAAPGKARIVSLRSPSSKLVWLKGLTTELGSSDLEILEAQDLCLRSTRGRPAGAAREQFCTDGLFADEIPRHSVFVSGFFIDRTEVTVQEYRACVSAQRCLPLRESEGAAHFFKPEHPVSLLTWSEAQAYCEFRGGRLPTEAEFERAARGGVRTNEHGPDGTERRARVFPWGDLFNSHVSNHGGPALRTPLGVSDEDAMSSDARDGFEELAPVGSFPSGATPEGVLDLAGNVAEWVYDLYAEYPKPKANSSVVSDVRDPKGPTTSETGMRVARGGHYKSSPAWLRAAARLAFPAETRSPLLGFRCVRERASYPEGNGP